MPCPGPLQDWGTDPGCWVRVALRGVPFREVPELWRAACPRSCPCLGINSSQSPVGLTEGTGYPLASRQTLWRAIQGPGVPAATARQVRSPLSSTPFAPQVLSLRARPRKPSLTFHLLKILTQGNSLKVTLYCKAFLNILTTDHFSSCIRHAHNLSFIIKEQGMSLWSAYRNFVQPWGGGGGEQDKLLKSSQSNSTREIDMYIH